MSVDLERLGALETFVLDALGHRGVRDLGASRRRGGQAGRDRQREGDEGNANAYYVPHGLGSANILRRPES